MSQQAADASGDMAASQARPLLLQVPPEILDRITWYLNTIEFCNLRLTCKFAEEALSFRFATEFFTRKQFMVSEFSLKALIDISKSRMAGYLRQVHIGLDQLDSASTGWSNMPPHAHRLYQQRVAEQATLWTLGLVPKYLSEAFSRLPNLEAVVVRDFNSSKRSRDGPQAHWHSYGTQTMFEETRVRPKPMHMPNWSSHHECDYAGRVFKAVIHGLGMANARPSAIEVMERQGNLLFDSSFHIHPDSEPALLPLLRALQRLHICIDVSWVSLGSAAHAYHHHNMAKFLRHCEALKDLRINGKRRDVSSGTCTSLLLLFVRLDHLESISLGMMSLAVSELVGFITKLAATLQHFELWRIQLMSEQGVHDDQLIEKRFSFFDQFLKKLLTIPNLNLRHIKLGMLRQMFNPPFKHRVEQEVNFKTNLGKGGGGDGSNAGTEVVDRTNEDEPTTNSLEYTGPDWKHFVRYEMIPRLHVPKKQWPREVQVSQQNYGGALVVADEPDSDDEED
ncbi:hypothetical protein Trco_001525 [Trichoderma cornu-damae]|uniref:F-box domain-containing protein n=1 Tax=Trichoderma cornu-damae TaxID=654480 RepID=A0A9P8QXH4_9HYPO|nr:hypothetical protein Trco_001525 [Trichoderma cornu-damae]